VNLFANEEYASLEYRTAGTMTNQADFPSITIQPTGKRYDFLCCFVFHIKNGKIDHVHEYFDMETAKAFVAAFTSDDIESFMNLVAPDGEWVIMATGETFRGLDQVG
jgi:ketosteroid isomerase-like protein